MRSWVGVLGSRRFPGGRRFCAVVASAQPGEVVRAGFAGGWAMMWVAVEVFGGAWQLGNRQVRSRADGVADVVGDAVRWLSRRRVGR